MLRIVAIALLSVLAPRAEAGAPCTDNRAIWASAEDQGVRTIVYGTEGVEYFSTLYFEQWRDSKLAWRASGRVTCSNGAVTCYADVDSRVDFQGDPASGATVVVEKIDDNNDQVSDWVVFAGLGQSLYYSGGAKVKWFNDFGPDDFDRVVMPNIYKFDGCRPSEAVVFQDPPATPNEDIVGQLYAIAPICERYAAHGYMFMQGLDRAANDGLWWMDDARLVGHEFDCEISSKAAKTVKLECAGEGETWSESRPIVDTAEGRKVGEVSLVKCE